MATKTISVRGARENNLQSIDLEIPRDKFVVITGLSGSGKSTLAFDTLYAEGQRRYIESLSSYARQFLNMMEKPDVDLIEGDRLVPERANEQLEYLNSLEENIKDSALVDILTSSLRRYALTKNIESAANSIEPAIETLSIKNENELYMLKYVSWAIPSIGFLGTVRGIGQAMSQAKEAIGGDITPMTSSLGVAFNSTFVALIVSVILMLFISFIQNLQDQQLVKIKEYVERYLIRRIVHD